MHHKYVAHSSPKDQPALEPHRYADHVREVERAGMAYAHTMMAYALFSLEKMNKYLGSLHLALLIHDIGKLETGNQAVLLGEQTGKLPYDHVDAGVAVAMQKEDSLAAWLVRAHHAPGLASYKDERGLKRRLGPDYLLRGKRHNRSDYSQSHITEHQSLIARTDSLREELVASHELTCGHNLSVNQTVPPENALVMRLLLSCLVDADHGDTAEYYLGKGSARLSDDIKTRWRDRLRQLKCKVEALQSNDPERQALRNELFNQCLADNLQERIVTCAAPVGLGKTTAVTANLLKRAIQYDLRRIFVIAPFTNVISQTAKRLREYLVLEGEDPYAVVAEHHHRVEFSSAELRQYAETWQAPIIVTTAVQFFETLASASPTTLRKLHQLPGSAVFVDEAHACVPPWLMRQSWYWIRQLSDIWSCHFVLASGSLIKYWEEPEIVGKDEIVGVPSLLHDDFFKETQSAERRRLTFSQLRDGNAVTKTQFLEEICNESIHGSRLIILNTVQSAAIVAQSLQVQLQVDMKGSTPISERVVLHLSTALAPVDREKIVEELIRRQTKTSKWKKRDWYLVATSCIEAGVDLDFDCGFRERCSLTSFLQTAGRINREGLNENSILYDFALIPSDGILAHPAFNDSIAIFDQYWKRFLSGNENLDTLSTLALKGEIQRTELNQSKKACDLFKDESNCNFQQVQQQFKIITADTLTVVVNDQVKDALTRNIPMKYRQIQNHSVQIWRTKLDQFGVTPCEQNAGVYVWNFGYDPNFLGYMKDIAKMIQHSGWIV